MGRSDSEDLQGHSVFDLQGVSPPGQGSGMGGSL
jgi:hypothetical protein